ncbi:MAG TPA: demethoxyubiquinone hydroxylase family protein [Alphaproteobacteria bacterium]|nr:demethoxyubiquinone hydroxylase family protein [Alphaproteobacteria bacterium]
MSEVAPHPKITAEDRLPGDLTKDELVERMIRVDHAGEYGAVRIYAGQRAVLRHGAAARAIDEMAEKEREHLAAFDRLVGERRVRPTALMPLWHIAGFALGAATAMMGVRAAMACTAAIEELIEGHYADQAAKLGDDEADLRETIEAYRADEIAHREEALAHDADQAPGYEILSGAIKTGSRLAIWLSTRI